jgi:phosphonate transport system substrate-binding protein
VSGGRILSRRAALSALGISACAGCFGEPAGRDKADPLDRLRADGQEPATLRIGVSPTNGKTTNALFEPLARYLDRRGLEAAFVSADSYEDVTRDLGAGDLDAAILSPLSWVKAREKLPAALVATAARSGSPTYLGYLIARASDAPTSLAALRGKRIAYVERGSTSGYLCPRALLRERGLDPDTFFGEAKMLGNHAAVITAVANGEVELGATASAFVDPERFDRVKEADQVIVLAKTARIPLDAAVVHTRLSQRVGHRLREALLAFSQSVQDSDALSHSWGVSGFVAPDERRYDGLAAMLATEPAP